MKIKPEHYAALKAVIEPLDTAENRARYERGEFPRADRTRDLAKRYRWDLLYASKYPVGELYSYLDDNHIDTALKAIVKQGAWFADG